MEKGFLFKDVYNNQLVGNMASNIVKSWGEFNTSSFVNAIISKLKPLSLSERSQLICTELFNHLPASYPKALAILINSIAEENNTTDKKEIEGFYYMPIASYVSQFGLQKEDFHLSMKALKEITKIFTSEFAIRPFIRKYPEETLEYLHLWTTDENAHVRRLVSEGSRPKLPWASPLKEFQKDPSPVLKLLEKLKEDEELYVRRSVANNLNDIAKDHPDLVIKTLNRWNKTNNKGTQWIIGHASRTLLKQGHPKALELLGFPQNVQIAVNNLSVNTPTCQLGNEIEFSFEIQSSSANKQNLMIDFIVHYMKANGRTAPKVFKLSKKSIPANGSICFKKKISFKPITTRKYYLGQHEIEIQINGRRYGKVSFVVE
ncbi:DNA alkylation repair protein [Labilibaculum manganireducens]|uniref:DNA alkylation repair protein n=1 Tax=Labilibaculum manganireducens TaxID=1940525 RepID=UPI0029F5989B|nr:DNA alkylation repair protein [Labilibaculum manganireducens]